MDTEIILVMDQVWIHLINFCVHENPEGGLAMCLPTAASNLEEGWQSSEGM